VLRAGGLRAEAARKDEALPRLAAVHPEGAVPKVAMLEGAVRRAASHPAAGALRPVSAGRRQLLPEGARGEAAVSTPAAPERLEAVPAPERLEAVPAPEAGWKATERGAARVEARDARRPSSASGWRESPSPGR
jgi:hypothetical protein